MADLTVEVARTVIQNLVYAMPLEKDAAGNVLDILEPPFSIQQTTTGALSSVNFELIVETLVVEAVVGTPQVTVAMHFDNSSFQVLTTGATVGNLAGDISLTATLAFQPEAGLPKVAFGIDFSDATPTLTLDAASMAKLTAAVGSLAEAIIDGVTSAATAALRGSGFVASGFDLGLTPGVASEQMLTVSATPVAVWIDTDTLAISAQYVASPPPFAAVGPFLEKGDPFAVALELSPEGFQQVVRNPSIRQLAKSSLSDRLVPQYANNFYVARGGTGGVSPADTQNARNQFDAYLLTPEGQQAWLDETPAPVAGGALVHHVSNVPDHFSDFDVEVYYVDLWLGDGKIAGEAKARGNVNGFGFDVTVPMWCTPVIDANMVEFKDFSIGDPDISIDLPWYLNVASGLLGGLIGGPLVGIIAPYLLAAVLSNLADSLIPSSALKAPTPDPQSLAQGGFPKGLTFDTITITTEYLLINGLWVVDVEDPKAFYPRVTLPPAVIVQTPVANTQMPPVAMNCLGALGIVVAGEPGAPVAPGSNAFAYVLHTFTSTATFSIDADSIPLPLQYFPWTVQFGYFSPDGYHTPVTASPVYPLVAGVMSVATTVWHPAPPFEGTTEAITFSVAVTSSKPGSYTLAFPVEAACLWASAKTRVVDAKGVDWELDQLSGVMNESITFGADFTAFKNRCGGGRKTVHFASTPSLLDPTWNPGPLISQELQTAIRNGDPGVGAKLGEIVKAGGQEALKALLSPSKILQVD